MNSESNQKIFTEVSLTEREVLTWAPLTLAYYGDVVYEHYIRQYVIMSFKGSVNKLTGKTIQFVNATAQSKAIKFLEDQLTAFEWKMVKKGRNKKSGTSAKNASITDYRYATGFETLIGALYLMGKHKRVEEIMALTIEYLKDE